MLVYGSDRALDHYFYQEWEGESLTWAGVDQVGHELKEELMSYGMMMDHPHCVQVMLGRPIDDETWEYLEEEDEWVVKGYIE
jgi:hypothetical protein